LVRTGTRNGVAVCARVPSGALLSPRALRLTQIGLDVGVKQLEERKPGNLMGPTKDDGGQFCGPVRRLSLAWLAKD
jgi:hypothetical protein